ncbi:armadillo-type protein [Peziza echinospora]|nr:armadillo-type protein [Peziza echinospora]
MASAYATNSVGDPSSPQKRSAASYLKSFVTPRTSRKSAILTNTVPANKQSPYLEIRQDTFVPLDEPLAPPRPPFFDSVSKGKPVKDSKNLFGTSGKGLHRKSISISSFGGGSPPTNEKPEASNRHSGIFSLSRGNGGAKEPEKKPNKARSTIDFSILKSKVRDASPAGRKGSGSDTSSRPQSSSSNYGLRFGRFGGKKPEMNKENQAPVTAPAAPPPSPITKVVTPGWGSPAQGPSPILPQSYFMTPRERPASYLQQQRSSQYTPVEARYAPASRGSDNAQQSPRQSLDQHRAPTALRSSGDAIALYTPNAYTPSSQRNFGCDVALKMRPKSAYYAPAPGSGFGAGDGVGIGGRRVSGGRGSWDTSSRVSTGDRSSRTTGSSSGDSVKSAISKSGSDGDKLDIDKAFEALLDNRGVAPNMRQKLRNLDPRVKQHFINNESELEKISTAPPPAPAPAAHAAHTVGGVSGLFSRRPPTSHAAKSSISSITAAEQKKLEEPFSPGTIFDPAAPKRTRPRSRTFGLVTKERSSSPTKKQRSGNSPTQPPPSPKKATMRIKATLLGPPAALISALEAAPAKASRDTIPPDDFVTYLQVAAVAPKKQPLNGGMKDVDIAKLHKLRLYLRNERLRWVEEFILLGGMNSIIDVLNRCLGIEWREDHEDAILHELLLCLKALCTASMALEKLKTVEKELFTRLIELIFDEERKGPSEFATRVLVFNIIFAYLAAAPPTESTAADANIDNRSTRAKRILDYLSDKAPPNRPIEFIEKIHTKRPYKKWCKEVSNVTKEVFWIFLHASNVIPAAQADSIAEGETYEARHFPQERPPVPAAPYVGGVEWEATIYLSSHLDLLNGIIASLPTQEERNSLREDLRNSGWEKVMGGTLRTCKERLHGCFAVHDGLKTWVKASAEDGWDAAVVRMGVVKTQASKHAGKIGLVQPSPESTKKELPIRASPEKKRELPVPVKPAHELPTLNLGARVEADGWAF